MRHMDKALEHDAIALRALADGRLVVRVDAGEVWRHKRVNPRTGSLVECEPERADLSHGSGYLRVSIGQALVKSHRIVWLAAHGAIAAGDEVNHKNRNKADNRIENLELLTHAGNVRHAQALGVDFSRGEANGQSKLTAEKVIEMRRLLDAGASRKSMARKFGVGFTTVRAIADGKHWRHLLANPPPLPSGPTPWQRRTRRPGPAPAIGASS